MSNYVDGWNSPDPDYSTCPHCNHTFYSESSSNIDDWEYTGSNEATTQWEGTSIETCPMCGTKFQELWWGSANLQGEELEAQEILDVKILNDNPTELIRCPRCDDFVEAEYPETTCHCGHTFNTEEVQSCWDDWPNSIENPNENPNDDFFVAVSNCNGDSILRIYKDDYKWKEELVSGNLDSGKKYLGYLSPNDILEWIASDYDADVMLMDRLTNPFWGKKKKKPSVGADVLKRAVKSRMADGGGFGDAAEAVSKQYGVPFTEVKSAYEWANPEKKKLWVPDEDQLSKWDALWEHKYLTTEQRSPIHRKL